jgi:hypothetical protein
VLLVLDHHLIMRKRRTYDGIDDKNTSNSSLLYVRMHVISTVYIGMLLISSV